MQVSRISCPHCAIALRIRDRMFVGKVIDCPECGQPLEIIADGPKQLAARTVDENPETKASAPNPKKRKTKKRRKPAAGAKSAKPSSRKNSNPEGTIFQRTNRALKNPVVVAWIAAAAATATLVTLAVSRPNNGTLPTDNGDSADPTTSTVPEVVIKNIPGLPVVAVKPKLRPVVPDVAVPPIIVAHAPAVAKRPVPEARKPTKAAEPRIDVAAALSVKILRFEQTKGVALKRLLFEIEELAGVPVIIDPTVPSSALSRRVMVRLKRTTVAEILAALLSKSGLTYTEEPIGIRVLPIMLKTGSETALP